MRQLVTAGAAASSQQTIASALEKLHSLFRRAGSIEVPLVCHSACTRPTAEGWSWALAQGRTVRVGRPSVVWLCGPDGWSPLRA